MLAFEAGESLCKRLRQFYEKHGRREMQAANAEEWLLQMADYYESRPEELNKQLRQQYGEDLGTMAAAEHVQRAVAGLVVEHESKLLFFRLLRARLEESEPKLYSQFIDALKDFDSNR